MANTNWKFGLFGLLPLFLLSFSAAALFFVGFGVAYPYGFTRHFSSDPTQCFVRAIKQNGVSSCSCSAHEDAECTSHHPCVEIVVDYVSHVRTARVWNATLYNSPFSYATYKRIQCSTSTCDEDEAVNNRTVDEFVRKYGVIGRSFPCYPGKDSDPEALLSIIEHWKVLLGMLLPSVIFIAAGVAEICYCVVYPRYKNR